MGTREWELGKNFPIFYTQYTVPNTQSKLGAISPLGKWFIPAFTAAFVHTCK
ncbi:hypothetical protein H1Q63_23305 [Desmonostoc muscorum CCALA 125]|nr:hypothetical protein [Desmonostoc muscorum CCALA 125]